MSNDTTSASGRFVLRIDPQLHAALRRSAAAAGMSLNELCARKLSRPDGVGSEDVANGVERACRLFGADLLGVVGFGSWARGEMADSSDIDLLVVVGPEIRIARELYDRWDAEGPAGVSRPLEPHFVRLIDAESPLSGLWAEVALDGIVLYDKSFEVSRGLGRIRRRIAAGELVRRSAHGHPYWTEAA